MYLHLGKGRGRALTTVSWARQLIPENLEHWPEQFVRWRRRNVYDCDNEGNDLDQMHRITEIYGMCASFAIPAHLNNRARPGVRESQAFEG